MYVSLYRRYRPQNFSDVVGQPAAITVLQQSTAEKRVGHAYLFSGPRGCGKTSVARILAKALNCLNPDEHCEPCGVCANCTAIAAGEHLDVIEIDGASNRGINEIRDLKSRVNLKPLNAVYKIYIIDEVHMLTEQAFNALLKTLEEPPSNVVFMLATTEPNKVPVTIRSRCQHIPFHRISMTDLVNRIAYICEKEGIKAESEAIWELARQADGALRDALSLTEQAVALGGGNLTLDSIKGLLGGSSRTELELLVTELREEPEKAALRLREIFSRGVSVETLLEALFNIYRDLWLYSLWGEKSFDAVEASDAEHEYLRREASGWTKQQLKAACRFCNELMPRARYGMKTEIITGLLLLGLTGLFDKSEDIQVNIPATGNAATLSAVAPQIKTAEEKATVAENKFTAPEKTAVTEKVYDKSNMGNSAVEESEAMSAVSKVLEEETEMVYPTVSVSFFQKESEPYDASALLQKLSETPLGKLISNIPQLQLEFAAALLNAEIEKAEDGWQLNFPVTKLSESFLKQPRNNAMLDKAICAVYGVTSVNTEEGAAEAETPVVEEVAEQIIQEEFPAPQEETKEQQISSNPSFERMLKLMGAELLYVEGENNEEETEEGEKQ